MSTSRFVTITALILPPPGASGREPAPSEREAGSVTKKTPSGAGGFAEEAARYPLAVAVEAPEDGVGAATAHAAAPILPWFQNLALLRRAVRDFKPNETLPDDLRLFGQRSVSDVFAGVTGMVAESNFRSSCARRGLSTVHLLDGFSTQEATILQMAGLITSAATPAASGLSADLALLQQIKISIQNERLQNPSHDPHLDNLRLLLPQALGSLLLADLLTPGLQERLDRELFERLPPDFQAGIAAPFRVTNRTFTMLFDHFFGREGRV